MALLEVRGVPPDGNMLLALWPGKLAHRSSLGFAVAPPARALRPRLTRFASPALAASLGSLTLGAGVQIFTLDTQIGEFVLTHPDVQMKSRGAIYSMNEANRGAWDAPLRTYIDDLQNGRGETGKQYTARYIGSMVGDVHRTLLYGGIFGYPADSKNANGKLRLLYEAAPMAFMRPGRSCRAANSCEICT